MKFGTTRMVLLIGPWVVKFPILTRNPIYKGRWRHGLAANRREALRWLDLRDRRLCPVLAACPFGLWLVMPRLDVPSAWIDIMGHPDIMNIAKLLPFSDCTNANFGYDQHGKLLLLDYGNRYQSLSPY